MTGTWASPAERLGRRLAVRDSGCLEWTGYTNPRGYGQIRVDGKRTLTNRFAWELVNGPIPAGMCALHRCDNPPCCQTAPTEGYPDGHLFLGTRVDNNADRDSKRRQWNMKKTHCLRGHPFDAANTMLRNSGKRECRACMTAREAARYQRNKVAA